MSKLPYLIIAGPIGVGKSTLTSRIHQDAGYQPLFEEPDDNPYLEDFYASQQQAGAFETQLAFLAARMQQGRRVAALLAQGQKVVQDRSVGEDAHIFTAYHFQQGLINRTQFKTYQRLYEGMVHFLPQPDLIVYLSAPVEVLKARIQQRGRSYEQTIAESYLEDLNQLYGLWAQKMRQSGLPLIEIDTSDSQDPSEIFATVSQKLGLNTSQPLPFKATA